MKTPEEQVDNVEKENKETIDNTIKFPARDKSITVFKEISIEKSRIEQAWQAVTKREQDILDVMLDNLDLTKDQILGINLDEATKQFVVTKKPVEKKAEMKVDKEPVKKEPIQEAVLAEAK